MSKASPTILTPIRVDPALHEALRRHAFERSVSLNYLVNSLLSLWVHRMTDPSDPYFSGRMAMTLPEAVPEKYPGYFDSLSPEPPDGD